MTSRFITGLIIATVFGAGLVTASASNAATAPAPEDKVTEQAAKQQNLANGESLGRGQGLVSANKEYKATFQSVTTYSNLVLTGPKGVIWTSGPVSGAGSVIMRDDNNLIIRGVTRREWSSGTEACATEATGALQAFVTNDGKFQIRGSGSLTVVWENGKLV